MCAVTGDDCTRFLTDERQRIVCVQAFNIVALRSHPSEILTNNDRRFGFRLYEIWLVDTRVVIVEIEDYGTVSEAIRYGYFVGIPAYELTSDGHVGAVMLRANAVSVSTQARVAGRII